MPQLRYSANALDNLRELVEFLRPKSPEAKLRAVARIRQALALLQHQPEIGAPIEGAPFQRNLPVGFGSTGYVVRYHYQSGAAAVIVLAIRHQKQAGFAGL